MPSHTKVVSGLGKSVPMPATASIGIGDAGGCPRAGAKGVSTIRVGGSGSAELGLDQQNPRSSKGLDLWCHLHGCHPVSARRLWGKRGAGGTGCPWGPRTQLPDAEPIQPCVAPGGKGCRGCGGKCGAHMWLWEGMPGGTPSHKHPGHRRRPCPWLGSCVRPQLPPAGTQQLVPAPQAVATAMQRGGDPRAVPRMGRCSFTRSHLPGRDVPSRNRPPSLLADLLMRSRFSGGSQALIPIKASRLEPALAQPAGYGSRRGAPGGPPAETGSREALANTRSCWKPALRAAALSTGLTSGAAAERGTSGRSRHEVGGAPQKRFS